MVISQKIKHRITMQSGNFPSGSTMKVSERKDSDRYLHTRVHGSIIHVHGKQPKCPSTDALINKIEHKHTKEGNSDTC